jgi:polysaccharide pyruvyl transferase WcaK-like protein
MRPPLKILHLSSFVGNIGDNASHIGFHTILSRFFPGGYQITQLEVRKSYGIYTLPDRWRFDDRFAALANQHDLLVIGGGVFLNFWIRNSVTGTTLDISADVWAKIKTPTLITSVGCVPNSEIPEGNVDKFRNFLDLLLASRNTVLAVRNDGSKGVLAEYVGKSYAERLPEVLDSAFFFNTSENPYHALPRKYIAVNVTLDQIRARWGTIQVDEEIYYDELQKVMTHLLTNTDFDLVFVPHIYTDHLAIARVLSGINDFHVRSRIQIAPYVQGDAGCKLLFSVYKASGLVVGTRFHSNVCSLAMDVPGIGLVALDTVKNMYDGLHLSDRYVRLDRRFGDDLIAKIRAALENRTDLIQTSKRECDVKRAQTIDMYDRFFSQLGLG